MQRSSIHTIHMPLDSKQPTPEAVLYEILISLKFVKVVYTYCDQIKSTTDKSMIHTVLNDVGTIIQIISSKYIYTQIMFLCI